MCSAVITNISEEIGDCLIVLVRILARFCTPGDNVCDDYIITRGTAIGLCPPNNSGGTAARRAARAIGNVDYESSSAGLQTGHEKFCEQRGSPVVPFGCTAQS